MNGEHLEKRGEKRKSAYSSQGMGSVTFKQLHERLGHMPTDKLRKLVEAANGPDVTGPLSLSSCEICDAIHMDKASNHLGMPRYLSFGVGCVITFDTHGPLPPDY